MNGVGQCALRPEMLLVSTLLLLALPNCTEAASASFIIYDPSSGEARYDAPFLIEGGGTSAVPFNTLGFVEIDIDLEAYYFPDGEIFRTNPETSERELVGYASEITWLQAGVYELDIYQYVIAPNRSPWDQFFAWLLPTAHAAPPNWEFIETITFTLTEGELPAAPCCSSVLFLPGIKGSVLKKGSDTLWPPTVWSDDIEQLALTEDGESIESVVVGGIVETFYGVEVYGDFVEYMDGLTDETGNGTIYEWVPFAYDWRKSIQETVDEGAFWESEGELVSLIETVEDLAQESKTGKVTIVAHSMGGLLGKALIKKLEDLEEAELIDNFIMVGTPQLGTPQGLTSLLHGDDESIGWGIVVDASEVRQVAQNMETAYQLLPSQRYFEEVTDPLITFDTESSFTDAWRGEWGSSISDFNSYQEFVTGAGVSRIEPTENQLLIPEILRSDLFTTVADSHGLYDTYSIPEHIRVVEIAGWGRPTVKSITYGDGHVLGFPPVPQQAYTVEYTVEGDKTVVYPSVLSSGTEERYFFDLAEYNSQEDIRPSEHKDLLSTQPLQGVVNSVLLGEPVTTSAFIQENKPDPDSIHDQLLVVTRSPVLLGASDSEGNFTGIDSDQNLDGDVLHVTQDIPGSTFIFSGGDQYLFVPKEGSYSFTFKGVGTGPTTVETATFSNNESVPVAVYTDIPTTPETLGTFIVNTEIEEPIVIAVDQTGDGVPDTTVTPDGYVPPDPTEPTFEELVAELKIKIQVLDVSQKLKTKLLKVIGKLEQKIERNKERKSKVLQNLENLINKKVQNGKIEAISANDVLSLIEELETQAGSFPLNESLISEFRTKVEALSIATKLKLNLLKRIDRLERLNGLLHSLERLTLLITTKGAQGKIPDADVQELLNLLTEIEGAL